MMEHPSIENVMLMQQYNELYDKLKSNAKNICESYLKEIFELGVEEIEWLQYTPGFNDGDPCYFTVWVESITAINEEPKGKYKHDQKYSVKLNEFFDFPEFMLKAAFGEDKKIIARYKNSEIVYEVEDYYA